jgi:hypothetical protein
MYGHTSVCVSPEHIKLGFAPCGNGDDYKLSKREKRDLQDIFDGKKNASEFVPDRPYKEKK